MNAFVRTCLICTVVQFLGNQLGCQAETIKSPNTTHVMNNLLRGYDKNERPNYGGDPVDLGITLYIIDISDIDEETHSMTFSMYFRQFWTDRRLTFPASLSPNGIISFSTLHEQIWRPDTFFPSVKSSNHFEITTPNTLTKLQHDGSIVYSNLYQMTTHCSMNHRYFPMDHPVCALDIESYGYTMKDITYKWHKGASTSVGISQEASISDFKLWSNRQQTKHVFLSSGNYSRLVVEVNFQRHMQYYIFNFYCPSMIVLAFAFLTLWMSPKAKLGRLALGITALFIMTFIFIGARASTPTTPCLTALDVYLGFTFIFMLAVLVQHAVIYHIETLDKDEEKLLEPCEKTTWRFSSFISEKYTRIALGVLIIIFNFLYWLIYTQKSSYAKFY